MSELVRFLRYSEDRHRLKRGGKSAFLIDADAIFDCEPLREFVVSKWVEELNLSRQRAGVTVYGVPNGGTPWARALAERLGIEWWEAGASLVGDIWVVDDVVTTGKSITEMGDTAVRTVQNRMAVVDRSRGAPVYCVWRMPLP